MLEPVGPGGSSAFGSLSASGGTGTINTSRIGGSNANYSGGTAVSGTDSGARAGGGANASVSVAGAGYLSSISGMATYYAGEGGAVVSAVGQSGGSGGSGIVIVSYPTGSLTASGGVVTT